MGWGGAGRGGAGARAIDGQRTKPVMDAAAAILTEIDTTPFRTPEAANSSGAFRLASGVLPRYPGPTPHPYPPSQATLDSAGGTTCSPGLWGPTETLENTELYPWNRATPWNLSVEEAGDNGTLDGPGWWGWGPQSSGGEQWSPGLLAVTGLALYTLALCTAVGNALVIHAIRTEKRLQTVSNLFIMSLAAADLTVGLTVMPISAAYAMMGEWRLGLAVCQFWLAADYTASTASIFNLVILSLDRYWSITAPLRYLRRRTRRRAWVMIGASWTAATAWLVPVLAWHHIARAGRRHHPAHVCETEFSESAVFKAVTAALNFYLPTALMVYLYCRIFREVQMRQALGRIPFTAHDPPTDSLSEGDRLPRPTPTPTTNHRPTPTSHHPASTTTSNATSTCTASSGGSDRSQFRSLTVVSPGRRDCCHYSGVVVSVEYLPEDNPTSQFYHQGPSGRRQAAGGRGGSHQNHIHCYQSNRPLQPCEKWGSSWRLGSVSNSDQNPPRPAPSPVPPATNGAKKKRGGGGGGGGGGVGGNSGGRRVDGVNLAKERKAARQLGVIVGAFLACWVPYFTLFPVMALCGTCVPPRAHTAAIWLGYLNSALNPVLYPLCNHNFRRAFARMLRLPSRKADPPPSVPHRLPTITTRH